MSDINISYKGSTIASMDASGTKTLLTSGKYCEDDVEIVYTRPSGGQAELVPFAIRPDAELIQSYRYDKHIVEDEGVTLPAYSTSSKLLLSTDSLSPEISINTGTYKILIVERFLSIPEYSTADSGKGRNECVLSESVYEVTKITPTSMKLISDPNRGTEKTGRLLVSSSSSRMLYWSSASAFAVNTTDMYGAYQNATAPSIYTNSITIASPSLRLRGHSSYFASEFWDALTDIRFQYAIDVYKAPYTDVDVLGWEHDQLLRHIITCSNSPTHKLT